MAVITLSRQSGSEGDEIAQILCERLGYQYFDKKVMAQLGAQMGLATDFDAGIDRHAAKSLLERWFGNYQNPFGDASGWTFGARSDAREGISVAHLVELMYAGYDKGNVVVVGRGGQAALAGKPDVLHVRVVAPMELRIKRRQEGEGLTAEIARQKVHERDAGDVDWIKRYFDRDINDPTLYDLIINTAKITPAAAADLIINALAAMPAKAKQAATSQGG